MAGQSGYTIWCNSRQMLALHFDTGGRFEVVADVSVAVLFGPQIGTQEEQERNTNSLELFHVLFNRERFFSFDQLLQKISVDEPTFLANATPLDTDLAQREFVSGSRTVFERLRLAALARIQTAISVGNIRRDLERRLGQEWSDAATNLSESIAADLRQPVDSILAVLYPRIGVLHPDDLARVEVAAAMARGGKLPASQKQPLVSWKERATRINTAARSLRLESSSQDFIGDAFAAWRERQPKAKLATESVFSEQVAYVFFVRLLLTRILEDKGLLPSRVASDGGFTAWRTIVSKYFGTNANELHSSPFMQLLAQRVGTFYQHFFGQPLFDWFLPDDYLLALTLEFLGRYSFASIGSDLLGFTYEGYVERVARSEKGHFLTRPAVVEYMLDTMDYSGHQIIDRRLIDPACGSGSFLVHAAQRLRKAMISALSARRGIDETTLLASEKHRLELAREYVTAVKASFFGIDIDPLPCYLAELNLLIQCLDDLHILLSAGQTEPIDSFHIFNADSLNLPDSVRYQTLSAPAIRLAATSTSASGELTDPSYSIKAREGDYSAGFYYVICNPPYVQVNTESFEAIPFLREALSGKANLYLLFIRLGIHLVSSGGRMVFIVPLTVLGDESASAARRLMMLGQRRVSDLVRFYTGNILFPGVDHAVTILQVVTSDPLPNQVNVSGGKTVNEARKNSKVVAQDRVLDNVPAGGNWGSSWLVSPDSSAYDVWEAVRANSTTTLANLWHPVFEESQGDLNATYVNPFRVSAKATGDVAIYKGEEVIRFAPLPSMPKSWAHPNVATNLSGTQKEVNRVLTRLAGLPEAEDGFVLREVGRLNTRYEFEMTWYKRDATRPIAFTHELWRFRRRPGIALTQAKAVFGVMSSRVISYLLNLFSTNNHVSSLQLGRLPIPDVNSLDVLEISGMVDDLLQRRATFRHKYAACGVQLPDIDGCLTLSPGAVLAMLRLPSASLDTLALRGEIQFNGLPNATLGSALGCTLTTPSGSSLAPVLPLFVEFHAHEQWQSTARQVLLP